MTLLKELQSHTGGLIRLKTDLFWYGGRGWDGAPGRVCLILDAIAHVPHAIARISPVARTPARMRPLAAAAFLLIDGCPQWIWVSQEDVELIT